MGKNISFLVHHSIDNVAVIVREDVKKSMTIHGKDMETGADLSIDTQDDIPLGHKIALKDFAKDDTVIKYGEDMGRTIQSISKGQHLHVHNTKTKRW